MNRFFVTVVILAAFFVGLVGGWRITMRNAEISFIDKHIAAITVFGMTDIYELEAVG